MTDKEMTDALAKELAVVDARILEARALNKPVASAPPPIGPEDAGSLTAVDDRRRTDAHSMARFAGAGMLETTAEERTILSAPLDPIADVRDDPSRKDGEGLPLLYVSHDTVRGRLMRAFGPGRWTPVPVEPPQSKTEGDSIVVTATIDLIVRGCFIGRAMGACRYFTRNRRMSPDDALEGAISDAIRRVGQKVLGIGLELFDPVARGRIREAREKVQAMVAKVDKADAEEAERKKAMAAVHAKAAEKHVSHEMLHATANEKFGLASMSDASVAELRTMWKWLETGKWA